MIFIHVNISVIFYRCTHSSTEAAYEVKWSDSLVMFAIKKLHRLDSYEQLTRNLFTYLIGLSSASLFSKLTRTLTKHIRKTRFHCKWTNTTTYSISCALRWNTNTFHGECTHIKNGSLISFTILFLAKVILHILRRRGLRVAFWLTKNNNQISKITSYHL